MEISSQAFLGAALAVSLPPLAVGRVGRAKRRPGWGCVKLDDPVSHPLPDSSFASLTLSHPPHRKSGGRDKSNAWPRIYVDKFPF